MGKQTGRKIYKWRAFGENHLFIPRARGATTAAKAKEVAKRQWKRKKFVPKRASKMDWGPPGKPIKGYVVSGSLREPKKRRGRPRVKSVGRLVLDVR